MSKTGKRRTTSPTDMPRKRLAKSSTINIKLNDGYSREDTISKLKESYKNNQRLSLDSGALLDPLPFPHCSLPDFVKDEKDVLERLKNELLELSFYERENDLYKFYQSDDMGKINTPYVNALKKLLYDEFRTWLQKITGIKLSSSIDMHCARYEYTDYLLCHDDKLEDRRIAYIYYLVPSWQQSDGGTLDLFNRDDNGQPDTIVKSLVPEWNKLVFFEVCPESFHQVSEILSEDKTRMAVSGWFHGPIIPEVMFDEPPLPTVEPLSLEPDVFMNWINPIYLDNQVQVQCQVKFLQDYDVHLPNFLNSEIYDQVIQELNSTSTQWKSIGPANRRKFSVIDGESGPVAKLLLSVLQSEAMFLSLSNLTGMSLHHLTGDEDGYCSLQLRKWQAGNYLLSTDNDTPVACLDVYLFLGYENWREELGGSLNYIQAQSDEVTTVSPESNALVIVFRSIGHNCFVKHINCKAGKHKFYSLNAQYYQRNED